ncbi:MAG TPA: gliding motility-associated protein GldE [Chitinophagaceae bacterium]|nr:gliding motility-associated protein GldE [Chitinophagaceae bacterium]
METLAVPSLLNFKLAYIAVIDPQVTTVLIILVLLLMVFSFIVSGAEVAYFSLTHKDINLLKTKQQLSYKRVVDLLEQPKALLASLLIANSFSNIAIIIISNILLDDWIKLPQFNFAWLEFVIKVIIVAIILLLFCEVMPKILARHNNIRFAKDVGGMVEAVFYLFRRPGSWLVKYSDIVERKLSGSASASYRTEEIYDAIDITTPGDDENSAKEKDILKGIVKFSNITVKQIMKTRLDVSGIDFKTSFKDLEKKIEELHYSRLPVYKDDLDEVVGIIHTKDVLPYLNKNDFDWHTLMRQPYFVHEYKLIEDLLKEFQLKRIHFAVVVDEFGGTSGIATLEDILEEVIGDIKDEFDEEESGFKKIDDYNYIFDGLTSINDVCKLMELPVDTFDNVKGESDSLGGLVLEIAGEIPKPNEVISSGDFDFTVLELVRNRLQKIKITIKPQPSA